MQKGKGEMNKYPKKRDCKHLYRSFFLFSKIRGFQLIILFISLKKDSTSMCKDTTF